MKDYEQIKAENKRLEKRVEELEHDINACATEPTKGAAAIDQNKRLYKHIKELETEIEENEKYTNELEDFIFKWWHESAPDDTKAWQKFCKEAHDILGYWEE